MTLRGRLAPSPTGFLHLGNAWTFLLAWLAARSAGGTVVLRMEDIDPQRARPEYAQAIMEDLRWLGLDWDEGPDAGGPYAPYTQQARMAAYHAALHRLSEQGLTYPCFCTRKELRALAGAPQAGDTGAPYPGTCRTLTPAARERFRAEGRASSLRLICGTAPERFTDALYGEHSSTLQECGGDFALCRSDGVVAYQLAVSVDDGLMDITQVVRGNDILPSTPRQIYLSRLLGFAAPAYGHVPLLLDAQGERLAKRHHSLTLRALRQAGLAPEHIVGLLAWLAGLQAALAPATPRALCAAFRWNVLPRADIRLDTLLYGLLPASLRP